MVDIPRSLRWTPGSDEGQLHYGPIYADSYAARKIGRLGSVSPYVRQRMKAQHGRYLSGLGSESPSGEIGHDPYFQGQETYDLEHQDDTYGSGIFDPGGRPGTSNSNMGVFASHYSLPGYLAREVPFTVSRDVSDVTDGAEVVVVPAGGMVYVEQRGKLTAPAVLGPTWRPPSLQPAGVTAREQPYAFLNRPGQPPAPALNPDAPVLGAPSYRPARTARQVAREVGASPGACGVPRTPVERRLPGRSMVSPLDASIGIRPYNAPCAGFGQEQAREPASAAQVAVAGVIAGAAVGLVVSVVMGRK